MKTTTSRTPASARSGTVRSAAVMDTGVTDRTVVRPPAWLFVATALLTLMCLMMAVAETNLWMHYLIDGGEFVSLIGLAFIAVENFSAASTIGTVTGIDSVMNITPRKNSFDGACGSCADTNCGRKVMKKRMIFGFIRLTPSPIEKLLPMEMPGPLFFSGEKAEP